jgi:amidohydrolase
VSLITEIEELHGQMIELRREIHAHPELGFDEHWTSDLVAGVLEEAGYEVHRNIGKTGIVGRMKVGTSNSTVGLRADMDALPIAEKNTFYYKSQKEGCMHACGHDGHTAMLLGAAIYLANTKCFDGTLNVIFQPAEEGLGGANAMVDEGLFDRFPCDAVYAMHNKPGLTAGDFGIFRGPMMASGALFEITIEGKATHGARPDLGNDPLIAASQIVLSLQTIVSRTLDPRSAAVVSVTQIHGGEAMNIIPQRIELMGTARCFSSKEMEIISQKVRAISQGICEAQGVKAEVSFKEVFPPLINNSDEAELAYSVCCDLIGKERVHDDLPLVMASEDFAVMLNKVPGCYINIGNGAYGSCGGCDVHNESYDFNDDILPTGAAFFVEIAKRRLSLK